MSTLNWKADLSTVEVSSQTQPFYISETRWKCMSKHQATESDYLEDYT